jgi:hypothetical protein
MDLYFVAALECDTSITVPSGRSLELYVEVAVAKLITGCDIGLVGWNEL